MRFGSRRYTMAASSGTMTTDVFSIKAVVEDGVVRSPKSSNAMQQK